MAERQLHLAEFVIHKQLGGGSFGFVYLIQHPEYGQVVFKKLTLNNENVFEQAKRQYELHRQILHPNVVTMYDTHMSPEPSCGLFIEYMEYGPVDEFIENFKVDWQWRLRILQCKIYTTFQLECVTYTSRSRQSFTVVSKVRIF